jgi:hypothetical protein
VRGELETGESRMNREQRDALNNSIREALAQTEHLKLNLNLDLKSRIRDLVDALRSELNIGRVKLVSRLLNPVRDDDLFTKQDCRVITFDYLGPVIVNVMCDGTFTVILDWRIRVPPYLNLSSIDEVIQVIKDSE